MHPRIGDFADAGGVFILGMMGFAQAIPAPANITIRLFLGIGNQFRPAYLGHELGGGEGGKIGIHDALESIRGIELKLMAFAPGTGQGNIHRIQDGIGVKALAQMRDGL